MMSKENRWTVGIDWSTRSHQACAMNVDGDVLGNCSFRHGGAGIREMAEWLLQVTGAKPGQVKVGIEVPRGPVVEMLLSLGFKAYALNPKQLDRFRDRFWMSGAKDDRRDAEVLASALRTDPQAFRKLNLPDQNTEILRALSRTVSDLVRERTRLGHRMRSRLWNYYPQLLEVAGSQLADAWILELWKLAPTPEEAQRLDEEALKTLLKHHRIRRINAAQLLRQLQQPSMQVAPGTAAAAVVQIGIAVEQLTLINKQLADTRGQIEHLLENFDSPEESTAADSDADPQHDVSILRSLPGVGPGVLSTLLSEAAEAVQNRDLSALRCLCGVAPVTIRSGGSCRVAKRRASHERLREALYHWARVAVQKDPTCKKKYQELRQRGHGHARALRSVADRLLAVACAMLTAQTEFNSQHPTKSSQCA